MEIEQGLLEVPNRTLNANVIKDIVLGKLHNDGLITEEQFNEYSEKHQVIVIKTSWFKKWKDKFYGNEPIGWVYKYIKFED